MIILSGIPLSELCQKNDPDNHASGRMCNISIKLSLITISKSEKLGADLTQSTAVPLSQFFLLVSVSKSTISGITIPSFSDNIFAEKTYLE